MEAYVQRAACYVILSHSQRSIFETRDYLEQARRDVDQAFAISELGYGELYLLRASIYAELANLEDRRIDREYLHSIELDNLLIAIKLGNSDEFSPRQVPYTLFNMGKCDKGMAELQKIREEEGRSAPPSASLLNIEAHGYLCQGKLEQALATENRSLAIQRDRGRELLRAVILYHLGHTDKSLEELNRLLEEKPNYSGNRYYLRALIHYERGETDLAIEDLIMGSGNTWGQGGLNAYVSGLIALDEGNREQGIELLQTALETLDWLYHPLFPKIESQLIALGAAPRTPQVSVRIEATPVPTFWLQPTSTPVDPNIIPTPPDPIRVEIEHGTGLIYFSNYYYPVYLFQPTDPISVRSVEQMDLNVISAVETSTPPFDLFIWNPTDGQWTMIALVWGANPVQDPSQYVDVDGNLFIAVRYEDEMEGTIDNLWPTLKVITSDGSTILLDLIR